MLKFVVIGSINEYFPQQNKLINEQPLRVHSKQPQQLSLKTHSRLPESRLLQKDKDTSDRSEIHPPAHDQQKSMQLRLRQQNEPFPRWMLAATRSIRFPESFEKGQEKQISHVWPQQGHHPLRLYLSQVTKKSKKIPAPNNYDIKIQNNRIGGIIPTRSETQPNQKIKHYPGFGAYDLDTIQMSHPSTFALSILKNTSSAKYYQSKTIDINHCKKNQKAKMLYFFIYQDDIQDKQFGKSIISRFRNAQTVNFGKEKRLPSIDKSKLAVPGFKYKIFSQFGHNYK